MRSISRPAWITLRNFVRVGYVAFAFIAACALLLLAGIYWYTIFLAMKRTVGL